MKNSENGFKANNTNGNKAIKNSETLRNPAIHIQNQIIYRPIIVRTIYVSLRIIQYMNCIK